MKNVFPCPEIYIESPRKYDLPGYRARLQDPQ